MKQIIYKGGINGRFDGFNRDKIFKMDNGTFWVQAKYRYSYRPDVIIAEIMGKSIMFVAGTQVEVKRIA